MTNTGEALFRTEKITERLSRVVMPGRTFGYLAIGTERAILIDTGCGLGEMKPFIDGLVGDLPLEVILTHGHVDHAGGAAEFDRVHLNERDYEIVKRGSSKAARTGYLKGTVPEGFVFTDDDLVAPKPDGYLPLNYGDTFDIGGEVLEIVCLGGHTPGSIGVLFRNDRILLTGDACCSWTLIFGGANSVKIPEFLANLEAVKRDYWDKFDMMLYSHPHNVGGKEVLTDMIQVCRDIIDGTDAHMPRDLHGVKAFLARVPDESRHDGKPVNVHYAADSVK